MKIKITEYMPGSTVSDIISHIRQHQQQIPQKRPNDPEPMSADEMGAITAWHTEFVASNIPPSGVSEMRFYTIQRVSAMNAGGQLVTESHRHTLEESDRIKKSSVMRWMQKTGRVGKKRSSVSFK